MTTFKKFTKIVAALTITVFLSGAYAANANPIIPSGMLPPGNSGGDGPAP